MGSVAVVPAGQRALLVMASDGLWDVIPEARAASLVLRALEEDPGAGAGCVADILLNQAISLRSKDDITVLVLDILPASRPGASATGSGSSHGAAPAP